MRTLQCSWDFFFLFSFSSYSIILTTVVLASMSLRKGRTTNCCHQCCREPLPAALVAINMPVAPELVEASIWRARLFMLYVYPPSCLLLCYKYISFESLPIVWGVAGSELRYISFGFCSRLMGLVRIMSGYANQPLDTHAHSLLKMVQYNGCFHLLYEPDFVIFSRCAGGSKQAECKQKEQPQS
jgi:hypothetical protein